MRPRILLVDDYEATRNSISLLLTASAHDLCGEASSGEEAIEKVTALKPDLVLLDYFLPGLTGMETMQRIRETAPETKIVVLTLDDQALQAAKAAGADACVNKADIVSQLERTIQKIFTPNEC